MKLQKINWWDEAECRYVGMEIFFDTNTVAAKQVCSVCPIAKQCLDAAMTEEYGTGKDKRFGVRGGLSARGRYRLALERGEPMQDNNGHIQERLAA